MSGAASMPIRLVIFDCDGVLVDSEPISNRVFAQMLGELGLSYSLQDMYEQFVGRSLADCMKLVVERLGHAPPEDFVLQLRARTHAALQAELLPVAGIEDALRALHARPLPYCVASSGELDKMQTTLGVTGLLHYFTGKLTSSSEVAHGKPAPDVYLLAAERARTAPSDCLVVEDSPIGVSAARAAGMQCVGYAAITPAARLLAAGARATFTDMRTLLSLLD